MQHTPNRIDLRAVLPTARVTTSSEADAATSHCRYLPGEVFLVAAGSGA